MKLRPSSAREHFGVDNGHKVDEGSCMPVNWMPSGSKGRSMKSALFSVLDVADGGCERIYLIWASNPMASCWMRRCQWDNAKRDWIVSEQPTATEETLFPIDENERERIWDFVVDTARENLPHLKVRKDSRGQTGIYRKWRLTSGMR